MAGVKRLLLACIVATWGSIPWAAGGEPAADAPDNVKKLLETGSAEELDKLFVPYEYSQRGGPEPPPSPSPREYAWQADILRTRLLDKDPAVRAVVLRILSALDYEAAIKWASDHLVSTQGEELVSCFHVLLGVHSGTETTDGRVLFPSYRVERDEFPGVKIYTPRDEIIVKVMKALEKADAPLNEISCYGLRVLLEQLAPSPPLRERIKAAARRRAFHVQEKGIIGVAERAMAILNLLDVNCKADLDVLLKATAPENPGFMRTGALGRLGELSGEKVVSELGRKYMGDPEEGVRTRAFSLLDTKEHFTWYLTYLAARKKEGAAIVAGHLGRNGEIEDALRTPSRYPFILKFTPEQVSWLEEAGLYKGYVQSWKKILEENKGARVPETEAPPAKAPTTLPASGESGSGELVAKGAKEASGRWPSVLGIVIVLLVALVIAGTVVVLRARKPRTP